MYRISLWSALVVIGFAVPGLAGTLFTSQSIGCAGSCANSGVLAGASSASVSGNGYTGVSSGQVGPGAFHAYAEVDLNSLVADQGGVGPSAEFQDLIGYDDDLIPTNSVNVLTGTAVLPLIFDGTLTESKSFSSTFPGTYATQEAYTALKPTGCFTYANGNFQGACDITSTDGAFADSSEEFFGSSGNASFTWDLAIPITYSATNTLDLGVELLSELSVVVSGGNYGQFDATAIGDFLNTAQFGPVTFYDSQGNNITQSVSLTSASGFDYLGTESPEPAAWMMLATGLIALVVWQGIRVRRASSAGISVREAGEISAILEDRRRVIETQEFQQRLTALEKCAGLLGREPDRNLWPISLSVDS